MIENKQLADTRLITSERTSQLLLAAAAEDQQYNLRRRQIAVGWHTDISTLPTELRELRPLDDELVVCSDLIYKGQRLFVPSTERTEMLDRIHSSHIGVYGCIRRAREALFSKGMNAVIT